MTQIPDTKELAIVKQQASKALTAANEIVIASPEDLSKATDVLSKIKTVGKMIKERKEAITKPLMEALNSSRDLFKPIEQNHAEAERIIKGKIISYQEEMDRKAEKARLALATRVEKGTMKAETAVAKMEDIQEAPKSAQGKVGSISTRTVKKYRVVDESKIPREFLMPNMGKITEAFKGGRDVPGIEVYEEKIIAAK